MQQNRYLTMDKKAHNPDGFYISKFSFETWAEENSKTIGSPTGITLFQMIPSYLIRVKPYRIN